MKFLPDHVEFDDGDYVGLSAAVAVIVPLFLIVLFISGCTDPNAGKFPPNAAQVNLQIREMTGSTLLP